MRKLIRAVRGLIAAPAMLFFIAGPTMAADQPIGAFEAGQQAAWNAHDAAAYTAAFASDADIITALGWHWAGQAEAARNLGEGFKYIYAHARLRLDVVQVRMQSADLALVTLRWNVAGAQAIDAGQPGGEQHGLASQVLQRHGDSWLILSQQDTAEHPLPSGMIPAPAPSAPSSPVTAPPPAAFPLSAPPVRRCILARANRQCLIYGKPPKS